MAIHARAGDSECQDCGLPTVECACLPESSDYGQGWDDQPVADY